MKENPSPSLLKFKDEEDEAEDAERKEALLTNQEDDDLEVLASRVQCMGRHKREPLRKGAEFSGEKYDLRRQEQKIRAATLEKELKARWAVEERIEEQLNRYRAHYYQAMVPTRLKDVTQLLMPKCTPPQELTSIAWLGDWRPSAILDLLLTLARSSSSLFSSSISTSGEFESLLSEIIREMRIEEAILDEEMAEIQATCVMHLPFSPINKQSGPASLACIQSEFKKIRKVVTKAQRLRFKALELVAKKVLSHTDAAEFLVGFARIQDLIHNIAAHQRLKKGPVSLSLKP